MEGRSFLEEISFPFLLVKQDSYAAGVKIASRQLPYDTIIKAKLFYPFVFKYAISARKGTPIDGTGKGEVQGALNAYSRSKQNSDAAGMLFYWGHKEPFTFATSSFYNGYSGDGPYGKYPLKIYNVKRELIYQEDSGRDNTGMTPVGGFRNQSSVAISMMETIKKPNLVYSGSPYTVISPVGHSKELWDYYWTSYSRGTDGRTINNSTNQPSLHNTYLDGYIVLRTKSIYDPCPYGYRTPTNGTYNDFKSNQSWTTYNYSGGKSWNNTTWIVPVGTSNCFRYAGYLANYVSATISTFYQHHSFIMYPGINYASRNDISHIAGESIRCIEDATVKASVISHVP